MEFGEEKNRRLKSEMLYSVVACIAGKIFRDIQFSAICNSARRDLVSLRVIVISIFDQLVAKRVKFSCNFYVVGL